MPTKDQPPVTRSPKRGAEAGNALWQLYRGLNWTDAKRFRDYLLSVNIGFATFQKQSWPGRTLGSVNVRNFQLYRQFFQGVSGHDLMDDFWAEERDNAPAPVLATQQYEANEGR